MRTLFSMITGALLLGTCASAQVGPAKSHHTADGFQNNYPHEMHGFLDLMRWRRDRLFGDKVTEEPEGGFGLPLVEDDPARVRPAVGEARITWVGHATLLLQVNGINVLTDPTWSDRASPLSWAGPRRITPPGLAFTHLPEIHAVIISHNHYDHLNLETLHRLRARQPHNPPVVLAPLVVGGWLRENGVPEALEFDWWESHELPGLRATAVPVQHFSARTPFDRNESLWSGWVLDWDNFRFYFGGDTGYSQDFKDVATRFPGIDLAALPIGAYAPRWFMKPVHLNPADAVLAHQDLAAKQSIAIHWGTFKLADDHPTEAPRFLARDLALAKVPPTRFWVFTHGETRSITPLLKRP